MHIFSNKPKTSQQTTIPTGPHFGQCPKMKSSFRSQGSLENQANGSYRFGAAGLGKDFSQIPVTTKAAGMIQPKLVASTPGDTHEQEADLIARQVMDMPESHGQAACSCNEQGSLSQSEKPNRNHKTLTMKRLESAAVGQIVEPSIVHDTLHSPGQPLETTARLFMESRFGRDFSQVRVHADSRAAESSRAVDALAFTVGHDVVFGAGQYAPQTTAGRRLIAHELAHVVQNSEIPSSRANTLSRYTLDDCDETDYGMIRKADAKATMMAGKALGGIRKWAEDNPDPDLNPAGKQDQRVTDLLISYFGFAAPGPLLEEVIDGYKRIDAKFTADDYQYECEDDCDGAYAYVYPFWTDVHICVDKLRGKPETFIAGVMLHEMSHYVARTDDIEYFYYGSPATTSLHPVYAIENADSYEGFAEEYYKLG